MYEDTLTRLVGKKVLKVYMNKDFLRFDTDSGPIVFRVEGECCSSSYFYDFYGVKNLLKNGPVTEVKGVLLDELKVRSLEGSGDVGGDLVQVYGYQITTVSEEWGEMTSVFSFRNYSNGYYGGSIETAIEQEVSPEITDDVVETN